MWKRWALLAASLFLGTALFSTNAVAAPQDEEVSAEDKKKAKAAFDRGRASFETNSFKDAADAFREAYELMPSWKLLYNIGQAEAASKRYGLALDAFERYLALGGDTVPEERKEEVISETTRLRAMVGSLDIKAPDGAVVFIDNVKRGTAPLPGRIKVTAGIEHIVFVELDSESIFTRTVIVSGGETITVDAHKKKAEPTPQDKPAEEVKTTEETRKDVEEKAKPGPLSITGWVLTGTGAAVLATGGIMGIVSIVKNGELEDNCPGGHCPSEGGWDDKITSLKTTSTLSTILLPTGAVLAGVGIALIIVGNKKQAQSDVALIPVTTPQFNGLILQGSF